MGTLVSTEIPCVELSGIIERCHKDFSWTLVRDSMLSTSSLLNVAKEETASHFSADLSGISAKYHWYNFNEQVELPKEIKIRTTMDISKITDANRKRWFLQGHFALPFLDNEPFVYDRPSPRALHIRFHYTDHTDDFKYAGDAMAGIPKTILNHEKAKRDFYALMKPYLRNP